MIYTSIQSLLVAAVPETHPWFVRFAVAVRHTGSLDAQPYRLTLYGACGVADTVVTLPSEPLSPGPYGPIWQERYATELDACARAQEIAPRVRVDAYSPEEAMRLVFMTGEGVWSP